MDYDEIPDADIVVAGPSCVPFSRNGKQASWDDPKSRSFLACLQCIRSQAVRAGTRLKLFVLENVLGFADTPKGQSTSPASEVMVWLEQELGPAWCVWSWKVSSVAAGLPHGRERLYICGRAKRLFLTPLPRRQPSDYQFPVIPLRSLLASDLESEVGKLSDKMQANFRHFQEVHSTDPVGSIVVCDLTRAAGKVRAPISKTDVTPTLTTRNTSLWIFEVGSEKYRRFLSPSERLMLQGFDARPIVEAIRDSNKIVVAAGNAMSVPAVALTIACGLSQML